MARDSFRYNIFRTCLRSGYAVSENSVFENRNVSVRKSTCVAEAQKTLFAARQSSLIKQVLIWAICLIPCIAQAQGDNFSSAIAYAYAYHPALKAERENLAAVHGGVWEAYAGFLPSANINYNYGPNRFKFEGFPGETVYSTTKALTVTEPLFNGGGTIAQITAANALTKSEKAHLQSTIQTVLLNAITAYIRMAETKGLLHANRQNISFLQQNLTATRTRFKARDVTVSDLGLSQSRTARAEADLSTAEGRYASARETYLHAVGLEPHVPGFPPPPPSVPLTEDEVAYQAERNPDLVAVQYQEKAAGSTVYAHASTLLPTVSLQGALQKETGLTTPFPPTSVAEKSLMLTVTIPIFQSGAEYARLSEANHQYARARFATQDAQLSARENALNGWHVYQANLQRLQDSRQAENAANQALDGIEHEYKAGERSVFDMLVAQQEVYDAHVGYIQAQADYLISAYQLLALVGALNPEVLHLPKVTLKSGRWAAAR